ASLIDADLLVLLTDVDGLYTDDPTVNARARRLETVEAVTDEIARLARDRTDGVSVGGMATKLQAARKAAAAGVPLIIASGREPPGGRAGRGELRRRRSAEDPGGEDDGDRGAAGVPELRRSDPPRQPRAPLGENHGRPRPRAGQGPRRPRRRARAGALPDEDQERRARADGPRTRRESRVAPRGEPGRRRAGAGPGRDAGVPGPSHADREPP